MMPMTDLVMLRAYVGEYDTRGHKAVLDCIVEEARKFGLAGATVRRGRSGFGEITKSLFVQSGFRAMWKTLRYAFEPAFMEHVDRLIESTPVAPIPDPTETWKSLVKQEIA